MLYTLPQYFLKIVVNVAKKLNKISSEKLPFVFCDTETKLVTFPRALSRSREAESQIVVG